MLPCASNVMPCGALAMPGFHLAGSVRLLPISSAAVFELSVATMLPALSRRMTRPLNSATAA